MLAQAVSTSLVLLLGSLLAKLLVDTHDTTSVGGNAHSLLRQALHWRDVAAQDVDPIMQLQHAASGAAFLHAARTISKDSELERIAGVDVSKLARGLEKRMTTARQNVQAVPPTTK